MKFRLGMLAAAAFTFATPAMAGAVFIPIFVPSAPQAPMAAPGDYSKIHTVAIVSGVGTTLRLQANQLFGKTKYQDIADWKIDDEVTSVVRKTIGDRFSVVDASYDPKALAAIPNGPWDNSTGALEKFLHTVQAPGVDAFIVVRPDLERNAPGYPGLAFQNGAAFNSEMVLLWADYEVDVVDAATFKIVAKGFSRYYGGAPGISPFARVALPVSAKLNDDTLDISPQQLQDLQGATSRLVAGSVSQTLEGLSLGYALVRPDEAALSSH